MLALLLDGNFRSPLNELPRRLPGRMQCCRSISVLKWQCIFTAISTELFSIVKMNNSNYGIFVEAVMTQPLVQ